MLQGTAISKDKKNRNNALVTPFSPAFNNLPRCHAKSTKPPITARANKAIKMLMMTAIRTTQDNTETLDKWFIMDETQQGSQHFLH